MVNSTTDINLQIEVYKKYKSEIFQSNGKAKPCSDNVYTTLIGELKNMSKKSIQTSINRNIKKILADHEVSVKKFVFVHLPCKC